jgi:pimeloyl-ACP methyl ester carboxylesterase
VIWDFQDSLARRLLLWAALSVVVGLALLMAQDPFLRGFGLQAILWGAIDAGIALFGLRSAQRDRGTRKRTPLEQATWLRRILLANAALDLLYITGGIWVLVSRGADPFIAGAGWGIVVQGAFLLLFDLAHALIVPMDEPAPVSGAIFAGEQHRPFHLEGGAPAAVLVHGFGGTPDEMRGVAETLRRQGWTVEAVLLPGFGEDFSHLSERTHEQWVEAVVEPAARLRAEGHGPLLFAGYSLGSAAALAASARVAPDAMVLIAPFWWPDPWWLKPVEFVVRPFLPSGFRPLRKADFSDPRLRDGIGKLMPGLDLDNPETQAAVRRLRVPLSLVDEIRALSREALAAAAALGVPALVVRGLGDQIVRAGPTRALVRALGDGAEYEELEADHGTILTGSPSWEALESSIAAFAASAAAGHDHSPVRRSTFEPAPAAS